MTVYWKLGIVALILALAFGAGFRFGGMGPKTELEALRAAQAANIAKAVLAERASAATELARVNSRLQEFENAPPDPIVPGVAHRVLVYARTAGCPVPGTSSATAGAGQASGVPRGDPELERLSQAAFDAASHDAARLDLCREVWPR